MQHNVSFLDLSLITFQRLFSVINRFMLSVLLGTKVITLSDD